MVQNKAIYVWWILFILPQIGIGILKDLHHLFRFYSDLPLFGLVFLPVSDIDPFYLFYFHRIYRQVNRANNRANNRTDSQTGGWTEGRTYGARMRVFWP